MTSIFNTNCNKYWDKGLTVTQILPGTKQGPDGWNNYIDQLPSQKTRDAWLADTRLCGIGLLTGHKIMDDKIIIGIDVDMDDYVAPVERMIGPYPSAKKGAKGLTIFALTDPDVRKMHIPKKGNRIIDVLSRSIAVLPPSIHPDTQKPYEWIGKPLTEVAFETLPYISKTDLELISAIISNENHLALMHGQSTHDAALALVASLVAISPDDHKILHFVKALFDDSYEGNTCMSSEYFGHSA